MVFLINDKKHKGSHRGRSVLLASLCFFLLFSFSPLRLYPQISHGGQPASFGNALSPGIPEISLPAPALDALRIEDIEDENQGFPRRIGIAVKAGIDVIRSGKNDVLPNGTRIWRLSVSCKDALAMSPYFDDFDLPEGCRMFVYDDALQFILGAYTLYNNQGRLFSTELIPGDRLVLEIDADPGVTALPECNISEISYVYRDLPEFLQSRGTSDDCEVNINCPEGDNWQYQKRGVARIYVKYNSGFFWCTGALLNNTLQNNDPFFLTADHCAPAVTPEDLLLWIFYFNYEAPGCENPTNNPTPYSLNGAVKLANANTSGSDFLLLRLSEEVPEYYEPYYNGWSIENLASLQGVTIHHPAGDIKKVSTYTVPLESSQWAGTPGTHWLVYWSETANGWGVTEGGSSGSPLFDNNGRIIGALTGGQSACEPNGAGTGPDQPDYYGKFSYSWDQNGSEPSQQLKYWLDPISSGVTTLTGKFASLTAAFQADKTFLLLDNTVKYSNLSSGLPVSWEWTFEGGDPGFYSGAEPPDIKYKNYGMFDTKLVVSDGIENDTLLFTDYIHVVGKVYPNPVSSIVNIYLEGELPIVVKAEVFNILGQKVLEDEINPNTTTKSVTIDLSSLPAGRPAGIYVIRLQVNQRFIFAKVMVSR